MAYEESIRSVTLLADSSVAVFTGVPGALGSPTDNSGNQYRFVKLTGSGTVGLATGAAATDPNVGVLQNKPQNTNGAATVAIRGISKVRAAGAITAGAPVYINSTGQATATAGTSARVGLAVTTVANAGELVSVLLQL